jgi:hypothetical protein
LPTDKVKKPRGTGFSKERRREGEKERKREGGIFRDLSRSLDYPVTG